MDYSRSANFDLMRIGKMRKTTRSSGKEWGHALNSDQFSNRIPYDSMQLAHQTGAEVFYFKAWHDDHQAGSWTITGSSKDRTKVL